MDPFLEKFFPAVYRRKHNKISQDSHYCKYNNQGLVVFTSSFYVAGLVASLFASHVTRKYGRKTSIISGGISFLLGSALNAGAMNLTMLISGRIMLGVGIGFSNQVGLNVECVLGSRISIEFRHVKYNDLVIWL
jgi:MFS family permease